MHFKKGSNPKTLLYKFRGEEPEASHAAMFVVFSRPLM